MDLFAQLFVNGLINGSHYALLGAGFGLIFATTRIVHFATHGALAGGFGDPDHPSWGQWQGS